MYHTGEKHLFMIPGKKLPRGAHPAQETGKKTSEQQWLPVSFFAGNYAIA